jgi:hypothetical protein
MANSFFANADGATFWWYMNSRENYGYIDHSKFAKEGSIQGFAKFCFDALHGEETQNISQHNKETWFWNHSRAFDAALAYAPRMEPPVAARSTELLWNQLAIFKRMHRREIVPLQARLALFDCFASVSQEEAQKMAATQAAGMSQQPSVQRPLAQAHMTPPGVESHGEAPANDDAKEHGSDADVSGDEADDEEFVP